MKRVKRLLLVFFLIPALWACGFVTFSMISLTSSPQDMNVTTDAIVIFTGGYNRVDQGLILFANGKASHLFISGVHPDVTQNDIKRRWAGETALPPCCLEVGKNANTTVENARETAAWAEKNDITSIRLVTSNYHMARAKLELSKAMKEVDIIPHPIVQDNLDTAERKIWDFLFSEYHKFLLRSVQLIFK